MMKILLSALGLVLAVCSVVAQSEAFRFMHLNVNDGLSHNHVTSCLKDSRGFLWIGTDFGLNRYDGYQIKTFFNDAHNPNSIGSNDINGIFETPDQTIAIATASGLNLYDPVTETFERNTTAFYNQYHLPSGNISSISKDSDGNFWFVLSSGVVVYNPHSKKSFTLRHDPRDSTSIAPGNITGITSDRNGNTWVIHANGLIEKLSRVGSGYKVSFRNRILSHKYKNEQYAYVLMADRDGDLWIFTLNGTIGVHFIDQGSNKISHLHQHARSMALTTNIVRSIVEDENGLIWIGTDHGGINLVDKKNQSIQYLLHNEADEKGPGQNSITLLYKDDTGIIWAGTFKKGLSYYHPNMIRFPLIQTRRTGDGLPFGDVNRFIEDDYGNLWIGTNGGGLIYYDRKHETFKQFRHDPEDPHSLSSDVIVSLCMDHQKKLWIGTYYGGLNSFDGKTFTRYSNDSDDDGSLSDHSVWEVFEDSEHRLWIGTLAQGLDLFDRKTKSFIHFKMGSPDSVYGNYISAIAEDSEGNLWIGTSEGLQLRLKDTGHFRVMRSEKGNQKSLSNNLIFDIKEDKTGNVWIGTSDGLNLYDKKTGQFTAFKKEHGLPHNSILTILEDGQGDLWLGTPNGLSRMRKPRKNGDGFSFLNYDEADGLQGKQFNENAAYKTRQGELIFGGANGFNIFKPEELGMNATPPRVVFTDLLLFQRSITPGEEVDNKVILKRSITETENIVLPANKNFFTIEFSAPGFFHPYKNEYQYLMEGLHQEWLSADSKSRKVTFTNLDPGDYVFNVKAANNDGVWSAQPAALKITVLPPFWKTAPAFILYAVVAMGTMFLIRRSIQEREKMKFAIEHERQEAIRMHQLDMMKIKFFTNVSHEFRTPLTLILTPIEKILKGNADPGHQNQFRMIQRNARRLLNLVNQLLDFRRLEVQEMKFNPSAGDIVQFIRETVYSFSDLSEKKNIAFTLNTSLTTLETIFDQDKLEKILFNLLSNAFKFTSEHGAVTVNVDREEHANGVWLKIEVRDTGIGIPSDKLDKIFDRFFQHDLPASIVNQGSGIGLSITKEFVKIHGGTIAVESVPDKGSCFTLRLPVQEVLHHENSREENSAMAESHSVSIAEVSDNHAKPVLLLVEDNEDFRFYLKDNLKFEFLIIEAHNGIDGWKKTIRHIPDLIVSDIMMPEMNGIDLCRKIRADERVSHIPTILLTARTQEEQRLEGFQSGADDYITKPFSFEILISRIRNLIAQREKFHKAFPRQIAIKASELNITSLDTKFIAQAIGHVEDNVSNAEFSVEELGRLLGISRANLYKKLLSLTGKSPLEFIRTIRLQHAAQLLEKSQLTVAEVAYQVGFNNPKYFTRYFKEEYHILPSLYGKRKG